MVNNNRTVLRKWHCCRLVLSEIPPTVTNLTKTRGKSSCQVRTRISLFPYFNLFYIRCRALSNNIIIYMKSFHTCLVRLHTYVCKNIFQTSEIKSIIYIYLKSRLYDVYSKILKATQTHHLLPDLCCLLSENILYIGPLWARHVGGKNTVKTNAWSVELNLQ